ncbi:hypothetical protein [Vreelandella alkaliphila]|uniref:Uncharacterized protein n=1 Tax=Vreelandella alkaliphila TaxID=272774 RepID=A0A7C9P197_9GAMM|nr:hypothetical protein [Halomonas alkaliphila]NDL70893.1 hypothetical protein [Halomonas alkaliphila]
MKDDGKQNGSEQEPEYLELPAFVTRETGEKHYGTRWSIILDLLDFVPSSLLSKGSALIAYLKRKVFRR